MATKYAITLIRVDQQLKTRLEKLCEKRGMTQTTLVSRVVNWFLGQDATIQAMVLDSLTKELMRPLARRLLDHLVDEDSPP